MSFLLNSLSYISAPMINQSDLPFRLLVERHGASMVYSQMLLPEKLLENQDYLEFHLRDLARAGNVPVVVQICGNDPEMVLRAAQKVQGACDGIDLNLGCPQESAREGHYGGYLLDKADWPISQGIIAALSKSLTVPVCAKLRLTPHTPFTLPLAQSLEACGATFITLHSRHVSSRRRRQGAADLGQVSILKQGLNVPVVSNGNVREFDDIARNIAHTGADGAMVAETLLGNPCLFENKIPDPVVISLEYLDLCREYPTVTLVNIQLHIRHFIEFQCSRTTWFRKFRSSLSDCKTVDEIEFLLLKVSRWCGAPISRESEDQDVS